MDNVGVDEYELLTARTQSAVAVVALSGAGVERFLRAHCRSAKKNTPDLTPGVFRVCKIIDDTGGEIDETVVTRIAPERAEIQCHGSVAVVARLESLLKASGFSPKTDAALSLETEFETTLTQAPTWKGARMLLRQTRDGLGAFLREAAALVATDPARVRESVRALLTRSERVAGLFHPRRVALAGLPNAGKSSIFNALAGQRQVVVSPVPGTTLDSVESLLAWEEVPFTLVDTAGLRATGDALETEGVRRAREILAGADATIYVVDATRGLTGADAENRTALQNIAMLAWNKTDLPDAKPAPPGAVSVSTETGAGIDTLRAAVVAAVFPDASDPDGPVAFTDRQRKIAMEVLSQLDSGKTEQAQRALQTF